MTFARAFMVASVLLGAFQLFTPSALACKCMMPTPDAAKEHATVVFEGQVKAVDAEPGSNGTGMGKKRVVLALVRTWKGLEKEESVELRTADSSAACGVDFEKDKSYLVYAVQGESGLEVNACGRTRPMSDATEDLAALGGGVTPVKVEPAPAATATEPAKPPATRSGGCATHASTSAASALFLVMPALGLVRSRRRKA